MRRGLPARCGFSPTAHAKGSHPEAHCTRRSVSFSSFSRNRSTCSSRDETARSKMRTDIQRNETVKRVLQIFAESIRPHHLGNGSYEATNCRFYPDREYRLA